jgi:DNA-binding LytR/AlgR family response regulator
MASSKIWLPTGIGKEGVYVSRILFIEVRDKHCRIVTVNNEYVMISPLTSFEAELPEAQFARIHKSYLVALRHVSVIGDLQLNVRGHIIPVSRRKMPGLKRRLKRNN